MEGWKNITYSESLPSVSGEEDAGVSTAIFWNRLVLVETLARKQTQSCWEQKQPMGKNKSEEKKEPVCVAS